MPDGEGRPFVLWGTCEQCGKRFRKQRDWQRFDKERCRNLWHATERRKALQAYRSSKKGQKGP